MGVVGNRSNWTWEKVFQELNGRIDFGDIIISGGAKGVDKYAQRFAELIGIPIFIYYPNKRLGIPECFYDRNKTIAKECNKLIAFNKKEHSGTSQTIRFAKELNKEVIEIN